MDDPWDLTTALAQPSVVQAGDTLWLRGGQYRGEFVSRISGATDRPIVVRQAPGERATIDGRLTIEGQNAYYWGFEVTYSDPTRVTDQPGSDPAHLARARMTVLVSGSHVKLINLVVHDLGDGLFSGAAAQGLEVYGSLFYNNGWLAPDGVKGHNLYLQNDGEQKTIADNVAFNSFAYGLHLYGSDAATLYNFRVEGNTIFNSGIGGGVATGGLPNILMRGADGRFGRSAFIDNNLYQDTGLATSVQFGAAGEQPGEDIEFRGNTVQGPLSFNESRRYVVSSNRVTSGSGVLSDETVLVGYRPPGADTARSTFQTNRWDGNVYASPPGNTQDPFFVGFSPDAPTLRFDEWRRRTGFDVTSTYVAGPLPADAARDIVVRPNRYEPGRALITIWNLSNAGVAGVNVSGVLRPGDRYEVHHVYDVFGPAVTTGTYVGGDIELPLTPRLAPAPIGLGTSGHPSNAFQVFVLRALQPSRVQGLLRP